MEAKEEIRSRLNIEDVIGEYVQLKRAGRNFKGLSPFSQEKSPSFMVSPEKHIWHDFSSGRGGDVFTFVMEVEGLDFRGAMELLARKAGVDLTQFQKGDGSLSKKKEKFYAMYERATLFYQKFLLKDDHARTYVSQKRGLIGETVLNFGIGYSPNSFDVLFTDLKKKGFSDKDILESGLVTRRRSGVGDMFRNRMMISLADPQGRPIGFTARLIDDDPNAPKYINSPQSLIYDKGRHVFGLHLAKEEIRKRDFAVIVEGNMDVIASHQAGVKNVVATAGTALTEYHLKSLSRFTQDVRLAFDADKAGIAATERAIGLASSIGITLGIIVIPSDIAKDADELIKKGVEHWVSAIESPKDPIEWLLGIYKSQYAFDSADGKRKVTDRILEIVRTIEDPVLLEHYLGVVSKRLDVSFESLNKKLNQKEQPQIKQLKPNKAGRATLPQSYQIQDKLLALALVHPEVLDYTKDLKPEAFFEKPIAEKLLKKVPLSPSEENDGKIRELQLIAENYPTLDDKDIHNVKSWVNRIQKEYKEKLVSDLTTKMFSSDDEAERKMLNEHIKQLNKDIEALKR